MSIVSIGTKWFLKSKGFWGFAGVALPIALDALGKATGLNISPSDAGDTMKVATDAWTVAMAGLALWGRWTASKPLTISPSEPTVSTKAK